MGLAKIKLYLHQLYVKEEQIYIWLFLQLVMNSVPLSVRSVGLDFAILVETNTPSLFLVSIQWDKVVINNYRPV